MYRDNVSPKGRGNFDFPPTSLWTPITPLNRPGAPAVSECTDSFAVRSTPWTPVGGKMIILSNT